MRLDQRGMRLMAGAFLGASTFADGTIWGFF